MAISVSISATVNFAATATLPLRHRHYMRPDCRIGGSQSFVTRFHSRCCRTSYLILPRLGREYMSCLYSPLAPPPPLRRHPPRLPPLYLFLLLHLYRAAALAVWQMQSGARFRPVVVSAIGAFLTSRAI